MKATETLIKYPSMSDYEKLDDRQLLVHQAYQVDYIGCKLNAFFREFEAYKEVQALSSLAVIERITSLEGHLGKEQVANQANLAWIAVRGHILRHTNPHLKDLKLNSGNSIEAFFSSEVKTKAAAVYILSTLPWNTYFPRLMVELLVTDEYRKAASWSGPACK